MKALTVGGAMVDIIVIIENAGIERISLLNAGTSFLLLEEGGKTEALDLSIHTGGGAINTAVAMARLGLSCSALIKLGTDQRADQILARLDEEGISRRWVVQDPQAPTGSSVHVSSHDRNAAVFTFRGANTLLAAGDLASGAFDVDLVYIANLSNEAAHCFPVIVEKAKQRGALVAANPGIRQLHLHGKTFQASLPSLDILTLNRREADEVVSMLEKGEAEDGDPLAFPPGAEVPPLATRGLHHEGRRVTLRGFFRALARRGVGSVVITDGRAGAFAAAEERIYHCPSRETVVLGTAGAGDAFAATFTAYRAGGAALDEALSAAELNAGSVLGQVDTQTGLMTRAALEAAMRGKKETSNVISWVL